MSEAARCLVITGLRLDRLGSDRHGVYQRFRMLLDAVAQAGFELDIVCAGGGADDVVARRHIEQELAVHWHRKVRVQALLRTRPDRRTPYLFQQVMACLSPSLGIGHRSAVAGGQLGAVRDALRQQPALILAHRLSCMGLLSEQTALPPVLFDLDDVEHVVASRRAARLPPGREKWFAWASVPVLKRQTGLAVRRAHRTFVCADADVHLVRELSRVSPERVMKVSNGVNSMPSCDRQIVSAPVFLMVGIYSYEPNAEGAAFFVREVWPLVLAKRPDAQLWLVGARGDLIDMPSPKPAGVKVWGFVDELSAVYARAMVVVCPILVGGGTRLKLIEAAMRGMPIVSTTVGAEGLSFKPESEILLRDGPRELADACLMLVGNPAQARNLGERAFQAARTLYARERIVADLAQVMCRVV